jgi:hypothetical protein
MPLLDMLDQLLPGCLIASYRVRVLLHNSKEQLFEQTRVAPFVEGVRVMRMLSNL